MTACDEFALSDAQQALWTAQAFDASGTAYRVPLLIALRGPLEPSRLEQALRALAQRHEALRTTFAATPAGPVQRISPIAAPLIEHVVLPGAGVLDDFVADQLARPLDPARLTLRCVIARCAPGHHVLFLDLHHLVCDGVSVALLAADLQALYRNETLAEPDYQYVDWSEWKASLPDDPETLDFWRARLAQLPPPPPLFPPRPGDAGRAHTLRARLDAPRWRQLQQAAKASGLTLFEWLLGVAAAYFAPAARGAALAVAVPWFNREREEFQHTVGCFIDTALLALEPDPERPFSAQLPGLAESVREHLTHAGLGWNRLSALWRSAWPQAAAPEPRLLFVLQNQLPALDGIPGLELTADAPDNGGAKYDLVVRIDREAPGTDGALLCLEFRDTVLSHAEAEQLLQDLPDWWDELSSRPAARTADLPRRWQARPAAAAPEDAASAQQNSNDGHDADTRTQELTRLLSAQWAQALGLAQVHADDNFFSLGGDSILALRLVAQLRDQGVRIKPRDLFQYPTPRALARSRRQPAPAAAAPAQAQTGPTPDLLPIERWFFGLALPHPAHWNQAVSLRLPAGTTRAGLEEALRQVHAAHPAFGLRWAFGEPGTARLLTDQAEPTFALLDASTAGHAQTQAHIDLTHGPLSALAWHESSGQLHWFIHHLAVDAVSWAILIQDLGHALWGTPPSRPAASSRTARLHAARNLATPQALAHWQARQTPPAESDPLPGAAGCYGGQQRVSASLPGFAARVRPLTDAGFTIEEILLAAVASLLGRESGRPCAALTLEHHGRDADSDAAASETGWFTVLAPWHMNWSPEAEGLDLLSDVVPALARWRRDAASWLPCAQRQEVPEGAALRLPSLSFNYLGRLDGDAPQGLTIEPLPDLPLHDPQGQRPFAHELLAWHVGDTLQLAWLAPGSLPASQVRGWLHSLQNGIEHLADEAASQGPRIPAGPLAPGLLYHHADAGDAGQADAAYTEQVCATLEGHIDPAGLRQAWQRCAQRHESLRTAFRFSPDGVLRRVLLPEASLPFKTLDLSASGDQAQTLFEQACAQERRAGFDPARAPLGRVLLARFDAQRWQLAFTHHHAILDGWSLPVLLEDLLAGQAAATAAAPPGILAVARAQAGQDEQALRAEWQPLLAGADAPAARGELALRSACREPDLDVDLVLEHDLSERIASRAADLGVSSTSWFLAAWALAAQALGLGRSPVFGLTVSGRQAELHGIDRHVGLTANTLPLTLDTAPELPFTELLRQAQSRSALLQASAHLSLADLHRLAGAPGEALFETLFVFENYPTHRMQGPDFSVSQVRMREQAHYPLALAVLPGASATLRLALRGGRASEATGRAILEGLAQILRLSAWRPELTCGRLRFHGAAQLGSRLALGHGPEAAPGQGSLYELLGRAAAQWPRQTAVLSDTEDWDYGTLQARARQAGQDFQQRALRPGQCVAFMCRRSPEWLAGVYGASFAGLAFLCIDPSLPAQRRAEMLQRSAAALLVVDEAGNDLEGLCGTPAARLAELLRQISEADTATAAPVATVPESLAYLVYTSGSTGRPKIVAVPQRGLHNLAQAQARQAGLLPGDRVYQFASISFDAAVSELAMAAWAGACLCLPAQGLPVAQIDFVADLARTRPTHITLPPSLAASLEPADFPGLRTLLVAGERSAASQLQALREADCAIINAYGPSEATVCATMGRWLHAQDPDLGLALDGVEIHVLDPLGQPCLDGVAGELAIGGAGLAWGYLGDPARTASVFVPHPWPRKPGERLYLSGDRAVRDRDGRLVFLGRKDRQVKLRGQRIELGEIEAGLGALEGVLAARADVRGTGNAARLVAWLQPQAGATLDFAACAQALQQRLPAAMQPQGWALVEHWPLNAVGKVDPARLPEPAALGTGTGSAAGDATVADGDPLLAAVLGIWRNALGHEVQADHDFYQAGGDSISAMRVSARLASLGLSIKARELLAGLSPRRIAALGRAADARTVPRAAHAGLLPLQARMLDHWQGRVPRWLLSLDIRLRPELDTDALVHAIEQAASRHDALRLDLDIAGQRLLRAENPPLLLRRGRDGAPAALLRQAREDLAQRHYRGLAAAVWEGAEPRLLHLAVHHLWMDVVSLRLLLDEIAEQLQPQALPRPDAPSFLDWAAALEQTAQAGHFDAELDTWRQTLRPGLPWATNLPTERPVETQATRQTWQIDLPDPLPAERWLEALLLQSLAQGLAAADTALLVECESHGRDALEAHDASATLGWFTACFPLCLRASRQPWQQAQALARALAALPSGGAGFAALRRWRGHLPGAEELATFDTACALSFNYLGPLPGAGSASHPLGEPQFTDHGDIDPALRRLRPLAIEAWREGRRLSLRWTWQADAWPQADAAMAAVLAALQDLLRQGHDSPTPAQTLSPDLNDDELSDLLSALDD